MQVGGGSTLSINEYDVYKNNPQTFKCSKAYFTLGDKTSYSQYLIGYLDEGSVTILYNWNNYGSATYSNGELTLNSSSTQYEMWVKIMYV